MRKVAFLFFLLFLFPGSLKADDLSLEKRVETLSKAVKELTEITYKLALKIKEIEKKLKMTKEDRVLGTAYQKTAETPQSKRESVSQKIETPLIIATIVRPNSTLKRWKKSGFIERLIRELPFARFYVSRKHYLIIYLPKGVEVEKAKLVSLGFNPPYIRPKSLPEGLSIMELKDFEIKQGGADAG